MQNNHWMAYLAISFLTKFVAFVLIGEKDCCQLWTYIYLSLRVIRKLYTWLIAALWICAIAILWLLLLPSIRNSWRPSHPIIIRFYWKIFFSENCIVHIIVSVLTSSVVDHGLGIRSCQKLVCSPQVW